VYLDKALTEQLEALAAQTRESAATRDQLQRTEVALHNEWTGHETSRQALAAAQLEIAQLGERVAGLASRLQEQEAHVASLDEKHRHAREALEHFRAAAKEQREQEQRRHEHQVQLLQIELRQAAETLRDKTQAILDLNRDNARLTEHQSRLDREVAALQQQTRQQQQELGTLRPLDAELKGLMARSAHEIATAEQLRADVGRLTGDLDTERARRREAEIESAKALARLEALEPLLRQISKPANDTNPGEAESGTLTGHRE
jgi:chromosome segregation ATPase